MGGDYSGFTFRPDKNFLRVLNQQGRVSLDTDQIEESYILTQRLQTETLDTFGRCVVPSETPDGFRIGLADENLTIAPGRIYVDGYLVENHGELPVEFDPILEKERGTNPVLYDKQSFFPDPPPLKRKGKILVYLDVWRREVTHLEDPDLLNPALGGIDPTTREQVVWQVKWLRVKSPNITCSSLNEEFPEWADEIQPSAGRLSTATVEVPSDQDPCLIPPSGGYRGLVNLCCRVEVHNGGLQGQGATFKYARHNASVAAHVESIDGKKLGVSSLGRDGDLGFKDGDWVEITDDHRELHGQAGVMGKIDRVEEGTDTIILDRSLSADDFPTSGPDHRTDAERHTRIRRWDHTNGTMRRIRNGREDGFVDVDANDGVIPIPSSDTQLVLENGVALQFTTVDSGLFKVGDYWTFTTRVADASVEILKAAPPRGVHHHYCRLALVNFDLVPHQVEADCRIIWPREESHKDCRCTVCVSEESHKNGTMTIQRALDQVKVEGGTVCLGVGIFDLGSSPLRISKAQSVQVKGQGWKTSLMFSDVLDRPPSAAISISDSVGVTLDNFSILSHVRGKANDPGGRCIDLRNSIAVSLENLILKQVRPSNTKDRGGPAVSLHGFLIQTVIRDNIFATETGIENRPVSFGSLAIPSSAPVGLAGFHVENCMFFCPSKGLSLTPSTIYYSLATRVAGNSFHGCASSAISLLGTVEGGSSCNIHGNTIHAEGDSIICGIDDASICYNAIGPVSSGSGGNGIVINAGDSATDILRCQVLGNRIVNIGGDAIHVASHLDSGNFENNEIESVGGAGFIMGPKISAGVLSIKNNQFRDIAPLANDTSRSEFGISLANVDQANVFGNTIKGVGRSAIQSNSRVAIRLDACQESRVAGNDVSEVGPSDGFVNASTGIEVIAPYGRLDINDNLIRRDQEPPTAPGESAWQAVHIKRTDTRGETNDDSTAVMSINNREFVRGRAGIKPAPSRRELMSIRGNWLEARGSRPTVEVRGKGSCVFNDNRCSLTSTSQFKQPTVDLLATSIVASANTFHRNQTAPCLALHANNQQVTVVGNIADGPILLNNEELQNPWKPLNVITE